MNRYLLDTNHFSAAIDRVSPVRERIYQLRRGGSRIATCIPVVCELEAGIQRTQDREGYERRMNVLLNHVKLWPINRKAARLFGEIHHQLRQRGRALSQIDMMVAALARSMNAVVLTADRDFEALPELRTENWLNQG